MRMEEAAAAACCWLHLIQKRICDSENKTGHRLQITNSKYRVRCKKQNRILVHRATDAKQHQPALELLIAHGEVGDACRDMYMKHLLVVPAAVGQRVSSGRGSRDKARTRTYEYDCF